MILYIVMQGVKIFGNVFEFYSMFIPCNLSLCLMPLLRLFCQVDINSKYNPS